MTYWFSAAVLLLILELFTGTVYLLVVSAALAGAAAAVYFTGSHTAGIITAAILSALGISWAHGRLKRRRALQNGNGGNDLDIGQTVTVVRPLAAGGYEVSYRGTLWQAQAEAPPAEGTAPETAVITGRRANTLIIRFI